MRTGPILCATLLPASWLLAASAGAQVLYQTGWESSPTDATPSWQTGQISGQNNWLNFNSGFGHQVVPTKFSLDTSPFGQPNSWQSIPRNPGGGAAMHLSTTTSDPWSAFQRETWVDLAPGWAARTPGNNVAVGSLDLLLPGGESLSTHFHGALMVGSGAGSPTIGGFAIRNSDRGIFMLDSAGDFYSTGATLPRDAWTSFSFTADFATGQTALRVGGAIVGSGHFNPAATGGLADWDLFNRNDPNQSISGHAFSDNYFIQVVPTPGAAALFTIGAFAAFGRRRR